jgi:hypothetical protein
MASTKRIKIRPSQRLQIASSQGYECFDCSGRLKSIFHIKALCLGGENDLSNLCALCPNCHSEKTQSDMQKHYDRKKEERTGLSKYFDPFSVYYIKPYPSRLYEVPKESSPIIPSDVDEIPCRNMVSFFNKFRCQKRENICHKMTL